ncbi:MAG: hypothetical protein MZV64_28005 [Ignavibacteriales bacterium]|nr:hypothetical protein [Ignavibacteriales bacterium]
MPLPSWIHIVAIEADGHGVVRRRPDAGGRGRRAASRGRDTLGAGARPCPRERARLRPGPPALVLPGAPDRS